jgi:hypothetical protein
MVFEYRMELDVELIYSPSNIMRPRDSKQEESKLDVLVTEESLEIASERGRTDGNGKGASQQEPLPPKAVTRK